jgi:riboflavin synthase alpha subunit
MSNAKRPTLERKVTRASESKRKDELNLGLSISVDGTVYTVRQGDLTSLDTMALRRETGYSFMGLLKAFQADPDIDLIAALVWLARRIDGEQMLAYADVASDIGYDVDIDVVGEAGEESDPEA